VRGMLAPLSPHEEEAALRKIGFDRSDPLEEEHVRRLLQLGLIEWNGGRWRLTAMGRGRRDGLASNEGHGTAPLGRVPLGR
jgi:hypothetical protein